MKPLARLCGLVAALTTVHIAAGQESDKKTMPRPALVLVDAKTQALIIAGNRGINSFQKPDVRRVEIPKETISKHALRDVKKKRGLPWQGVESYNREWAVKSVKMVLADNTVIESQALVRMEEAEQAILDKDVRMGLTIEVVGNQGVEIWYCYQSVYEAPVVPSADRTAQKSDMEGLQGTWRISSSQHTENMFLFDDRVERHKVIVKGDTLTYESGTGDSYYRGRFCLDPVTKTFDWSPAHSAIGPQHGATVPLRGIYELKGDDMKIHFDEHGWVRPDTFEFKEGWLLVLKRKKP